MAALDADAVDPTTLDGAVATMTTFLESLRAFEANIFSTPIDGTLGRLLIATGEPELARRQLDTGLQLARSTGMHYYDAELLRLRALTHDDPAARRADLEAALEIARRQGARLFGLRAALDDFELRGERCTRIPWRMRSAACRMTAFSPKWPGRGLRYDLHR